MQIPFRGSANSVSLCATTLLVINQNDNLHQHQQIFSPCNRAGFEVDNLGRLIPKLLPRTGHHRGDLLCNWHLLVVLLGQSGHLKQTADEANNLHVPHYFNTNPTIIVITLSSAHCSLVYVLFQKTAFTPSLIGQILSLFVNTVKTKQKAAGTWELYRAAMKSSALFTVSATVLVRD